MLQLHRTGITSSQLTFICSKSTTETELTIETKLTIENPEQYHWRRSGVFIVNFEYNSHVFLMFLLLTLNK